MRSDSAEARCIDAWRSMASSPQPSGRGDMGKIPRKRVRLLYERRIGFYSFLLALPGIVVSGILIWLHPWSTESNLALSFRELFFGWELALGLNEQPTGPLRPLAIAFAALRERAYSFRRRGAATEKPL